MPPIVELKKLPARHWIGIRRRVKPRPPCYEVYITDPGAEPDPKKWKTEIVYPLL